MYTLVYYNVVLCYITFKLLLTSQATSEKYLVNNYGALTAHDIYIYIYMYVYICIYKQAWSAPV